MLIKETEYSKVIEITPINLDPESIEVEYDNFTATIYYNLDMFHNGKIVISVSSMSAVDENGFVLLTVLDEIAIENSIEINEQDFDWQTYREDQFKTECNI
ncbi:MAG: hypothetical protein ACE1ZQ_09370 [Ignavibacteriaceae bacterium]